MLDAYIYKGLRSPFGRHAGALAQIAKELGYAFINYWLSPPIQQKWAEKFYWTPANPHVKIPSSVAPLIPVTQEELGRIPRWDYVWLNTSGAREAMTDAWNRQVKSC